MSINEDVYGAADTWADAYYQQRAIVNKNKIGNFGNNTYTLAQGVSKGKLTYNEGIDKSISFCGLGKESALSHIAFIARTSSNTADVLSVNERLATNFGFFERVDNSMTFDGTDYRTNDKQNYAWGDYSNLYNFTKTLRPLTVVNPHNLVLCIYVKCADANHNNPQTMTLKSYIQNYTQLRPRIYKVWVQPYFGDTIPRETEAGRGSPDYRKPLQIGILDEYDFTAKELKFNSYQLQAGNVIFGSFASGDYFYNISESFAVVAFTPNSREHLKIEYIRDGDYYRTSFEYYAEFEEDILKTVACFGLYFTTDNNVAQSGALTNNDMYIGLLDGNGIGHGEYLRGAETANAPQNNWNDMSEADYDPSKPIDPNTYSNSTPFTLTTASTNSMYPYYVDDTALSILSAMQEITDLPDPGNDSWLFNRNFLFQEPIECIVAWRRVHCKKPLLTPNKTNIAIGWFRTQDDASKAYTSSAEVTRDKIFETIIWKKYNNFLDYEPYTRMSLYFPFCGMKELPLATFMGHNIELYSVINHRTGEIEVIICVDGKQWGNMTGNCSEELQLSANKSIEYIKTKLQLQQRLDDTNFGMITSILGNAAGATISAAHGNLAGAIIQGGSALASANKGIDDAANLKFQLNHLPNKIVNLQKGSPTIQVCDYLFPYILIQRPVLMSGYNSELYGKTTGFATLENRMKSSLRGYTEATNPILDGISCTETERNMIIKALQEGCIFDEEL